MICCEFVCGFEIFKLFFCLIRHHVLVIFSVHAQTDEYGSSAISLLTFNLSSVFSFFSFPFNLFSFLPALYTMPLLQEQITWTELICLILTSCQLLLINCYVIMVSGYFQGDVLILNYNVFLKDLYRNCSSLWHRLFSLFMCKQGDVSKVRKKEEKRSERKHHS